MVKSKEQSVTAVKNKTMNTQRQQPNEENGVTIQHVINISNHPGVENRITIETKVDRNGDTVVHIESRPKEHGLESFFWVVKIAAVLAGLAMGIAAHLAK